jgi:ABC-type enterobactin transport system permease subunit
MSRFKTDALERTLRTTVQVTAAAVLALWIQAGSFGNLDWQAVWQTAAFAAGLSLLMALAGRQVGSNDDGSFVKKNDG